ncbi:hypothetical protein BD770DRAFT_445765 [Pilaira anomala]|nr:hypothetical protein BD770DRAFT_445765 [Pilaira anomala]
MYSYSLPKKRNHRISFDSDMSQVNLPRKKFISEESFAKDMAAMSLDPVVNSNRLRETNFSHANNADILELGLADDEEEGEEEEEDEEEEEEDMMPLDTNGKPIIDLDRNGLPVEIRPGENKPRIPDFVLKSTELTDPRDILAYQKMLKSLNSKPHKLKQIEILNKPSECFTPTSMDID